jgi:MFS family permease
MMLMNKIDDDSVSHESNWTKSTFMIKKNVFIIGISWTFLFTAFQSMANLQSSLNSDEGLGTISLSIIYITLVLSCSFLPPMLIDRYGIKLTIIMSQFSYLLFIAANIYPKWYFLLPSAAIVGIGAGPLWTAKCAYLTDLAGFFSTLTNESNEVVVNRFFGIFFSMFQMSQIIGNLISSTVLKPEIEGEFKIGFNNACGKYDCPNNSNGVKIKKPQLFTVYTLCGIYILLGLASILLIVLFLKSYHKNTPKKKETLSHSSISFELFISTLKQLKNKYQLLIIPMTLWLGFSLAFIGADFTKSFVACNIGVDKVGYSMICFGLSDAIFSYIFGKLVKRLGRVTCILFGAKINFSIILLMLNIDLTESSEYLLYVIPLFWGIADAVWQTQVNSIYGVLFQANKEAAFSNFRLWESLGFAISYAYSNSLCTSAKLYLLLFYLVFGVACYLLIELMEVKAKNHNSSVLQIVQCIIKDNKTKLKVGFIIFIVILYFKLS